MNCIKKQKLYIIVHCINTSLQLILLFYLTFLVRDTSYLSEGCECLLLLEVTDGVICD